MGYFICILIIGLIASQIWAFNDNDDVLYMLTKRKVHKRFKDFKVGDIVRVVTAPKGGWSTGVDGFKGYEGVLTHLEFYEMNMIYGRDYGTLSIGGETSSLTCPGLSNVILEKLN